MSILLLACSAVWAVAAPLFAPEPGVLVLKNGRVIAGGILREGDRYIVTIGEVESQAELKIPANDVLFACRDMVEAYDRKRDLIRELAVRPHLNLAEWCISHGLLDRAADEIVEALRIDATDPEIAPVERRLKLAAAPKATKPPPTYTLPPTQEDIATAVRSLPDDAVTQFTATVQPLLLARCATNACHGPNSTATYHLVRPPAKNVNTLRETQRNLFASLAQIRPSGASPLLTVPQDPHGGMKSAVLTERDRRQIAELAAWIDAVRSTTPETETRETKRESMVRPADYQEPVPTVGGKVKRLPSVEPASFNAPAGARPLNKNQPAESEQDAGGDPFDAERFNQRFFGDKK
ncbi:MAG TPA: hypothetical protein VL096_03255 [Pirellulaceae bacterium]|nr:hypothetical protein [Pirellulaceae bacterium]